MGFSFGLEMIVTASMSLIIYVGAFMKNSLATLVACVWCGMALLRSTGVKLQSKRGTVVICSLKYLSKSRLGGSIPLLRTICLRGLRLSSLSYVPVATLPRPIEIRERLMRETIPWLAIANYR